jgi:hypothetical protein
LSPSILIRWSGLGTIVAGALVTTLPLVHPNHDAAGYTSAIWVPAHLMPHAGAVLALFGLVGLLARQLERAGWLGVFGFVTAFIGTASLLTGAMVEAFIIPFIGLQTPDVVDGPPPPGIGEAFMTISILFAVGYVVLGVATARAGVLPRSVGVLLAVGAAALMFGDTVATGVFGNENLWGVGFALFGAALAWLGYTLWSDPSLIGDARRAARGPRTRRLVSDTRFAAASTSSSSSSVR